MTGCPHSPCEELLALGQRGEQRWRRLVMANMAIFAAVGLVLSGLFFALNLRFERAMREGIVNRGMIVDQRQLLRQMEEDRDLQDRRYRLLVREIEMLRRRSGGADDAPRGR